MEKAKKQGGRGQRPFITSLKLIPNLVPKPLWGISAVKLLDQSSGLESITIQSKAHRLNPLARARPRWEIIRRDTLADAGHNCSICGATGGTLHCHEKWKYDDEKQTATLTDFISICETCHDAIHIGRTSKMGRRKEAIAHLSRVNGIRTAHAESLAQDAVTLWARRNQIKWSVAV